MRDRRSPDASLWVVGNLTIDDVVLSNGSTGMGLCGGNAIFAALGAHVWHGAVGLAARVGPDFPRAHIERLEAEGIALAVQSVPWRSIHNWALYESDDRRRYINWMDSGSHLEQSLTADELPTPIFDALGCHIAPMPLDVQAGLVQRLKDRGGGLISLDPHDEYIPGHEARLQSLLAAIDLFLPSRAEARLLLGRDDPEQAAREFARSGPKAVAVKLGAEGSVVCSADGPTLYVPAVPVDAIDPTGAGDAYCGGFLAAYVQRLDPSAAAACGSVSASFVVERRGALAMLPIDGIVAKQRLDDLTATIAFPSAAETSRKEPQRAHG